MNTKVSLVTVCYNSEKTIEDTIKSVIAQDYPNIEYIIVDGNSSDGTLEIVHKYTDHITRLVSEKDMGIYDAMNKGVRLATGDIIGILNSDDIFATNDVIFKIVNAFEMNLNFDAVYGNIAYFDDQPEKVVRKWISKPYYENFFSDGNVAPHPSLFVKKHVYDNIGLYYPHFKISSDYEFMLRAFKVYEFKPLFLDQLVVYMRMGGESTRSYKNILIANREIIASWKMNGISPPFWFWPFRIIKKVFQYIRK